MHQRAEDQHEDVHPTEEPRRLTTADMARVDERPIVEPRVEHDRTEESHPETAGNITVLGARGDRPAATPAETPHQDEHTPLFATHDAERFRTEWTDIQTDFVDDPRHTVERADELVASTIKRLAEVFSHERRKLEEQWTRGDQVSTEDLRLALQRYRSFFDRLLSL